MSNISGTEFLAFLSTCGHDVDVPRALTGHGKLERITQGSDRSARTPGLVHFGPSGAEETALVDHSPITLISTFLARRPSNSP